MIRGVYLLYSSCSKLPIALTSSPFNPLLYVPDILVSATISSLTFLTHLFLPSNERRIRDIFP
jgi:hypothetical protein